MSLGTDAKRLCPACRGSSFKLGKVRGKSEMEFAPEDADWWARNTIFAGTTLEAHACVRCGHVQIFLARRDSPLGGP